MADENNPNGGNGGSNGGPRERTGKSGWWSESLPA